MPLIILIECTNCGRTASKTLSKEVTPETVERVFKLPYGWESVTAEVRTGDEVLSTHADILCDRCFGHFKENQ